MSVIKELYSALIVQINTDAPEIKTVRLWNSQLDNDTTEEAIAFPAVFVDFSSIVWTGKQKQGQQGAFEITFHIVMERYQTEALDTFDRIQEVYLALQGFCGLQRITEVQDTNHDMCIDWMMTFSAVFDDTTANPDVGKTTTTLTDVEFQTDLDIDDLVIRTGDGVFP